MQFVGYKLVVCFIKFLYIFFAFQLIVSLNFLLTAHKPTWQLIKFPSCLYGASTQVDEVVYLSIMKQHLSTLNRAQSNRTCLHCTPNEAKLSTCKIYIIPANTIITQSGWTYTQNLYLHTQNISKVLRE